MNISIIVPCEEEGIEKLREDFLPVVCELALSEPVEVIFVDDGSKDKTWDLLIQTFGKLERQSGLTFKFEHHPVNRGLGAAIRTGLAASGGDVVVTTDSDGTYRFTSIPTLLRYLKPGVDIVTASPYHPEGAVVGVPGYRLLLSQGASLLYRLILAGLGMNVHTYTALYRAYRRPVVDSVKFESNGFLAGTELMVKAMLMGYRVAEYPTVLYSRQHGISKAKLARIVRAHLSFQWKVLLHRLGVRPLVERQSYVAAVNARQAETSACTQP
ncbi:MAG: glycosyl transferase [Candidatus Roseilinea sp.]|nr:MAG: glycosyl transferase [Candidatus Roseilinea sp.]